MRKDGTASRSGRHKIIVGADLETDARLMDNGRKESFICQWAWAEAPDRKAMEWPSPVHGFTKEEFEMHLRNIMKNRSTVYVIYFHNLRYDIQFFRDVLYRFALEIAEDLETEEEPCMIFRDDSPIIVRVGNLEFRDSLKKIPNTTVAQIGEMVGIPKLESPRGNFKMGWSTNPPLTNEDFQYVDHDALIVARAMKSFHDAGNNHATISGDAWADIITVFNEHHYTVLQNGQHKGLWKEYFPELDFRTDEFLRKGYYGGLNISWKKGIINHPVHVDRNSQYPSVMAGIASKPSNRVPILPYGMPVQIPNGADIYEWCKSHDYPLFVINGYCKLKLKNGVKPWFKFKMKADCMMEGIETWDSVIECHAWHNLTFTSIDVENISRFYTITWDAKRDITALAFKGRAGLFKEYVDKWYAKKKQATDGSIERQEAKLMLNSAYGRFGLSAEITDTEFEWNEELDDIVFTFHDDISDHIGGYIPVAMFVTSWARWALCDAILTIGCDNVAHCDTDSVIFEGTKEMAYPLGNTKELGDWGFEGRKDETGQKSVFMEIEGGVKRYIEIFTDNVQTLDDITVTCAGIPQKEKDGIPSGMWIELLDNPMLIASDEYTFGHEHYRIQSEWLRNLVAKGGYNPDDMRTFKTHSGKSTWTKGGVTIEDTDTFTLSDRAMVKTRMKR